MTALAHEPASQFDHEAFVYQTDDEYADVLGPLLRSALDAGDAAYVVVPPAQEAALRGAVGDEARDISWVDAREWYMNPTRTIAGYDGILRGLEPGRSAFVIGEVQFGEDPRAWAEWTRYEAALNRVLEHHRARVICPYDLRSLSAGVVADAHRTHPLDLGRAGVIRSEIYTEPEALIPALPLAPVSPNWQPLLELAPGLSLRQARREFAEAATNAGFSPDRVHEMTVAVSEVVTNGFLHGRAPLSLTLWVRDGEIVCRVDDSGDGRIDPLAGFRPPGDNDTGGRGLYYTRQVFDHVELGPASTGGLCVHMSATA